MLHTGSQLQGDENTSPVIVVRYDYRMAYPTLIHAPLGVFRVYIGELLFHMYLRKTVRRSTADTVCCVSFKCFNGYDLIDNADNKGYRYGKCDTAHCCDNICHATIALSTTR